MPKKARRWALERFRRDNRMTQEDFAKAIGYSRSQYALIEQGKRDGTQEFWKKLQARFNVEDCAMWELMKIDEQEGRYAAERKA